MHRVEALVAGIRGAENGTFSAVIRGTSTPATYYTDFEGNGAATATSVALDQYGGKVAFFDRPVTITAYSSGGSTVRTWTAGDDAGAVELKSQSFNGTAYSGGGVARGNPTTVEAALDKWYDSAGTADFQVPINGVATNISSAFSSVAGLRYFVVTDSAYGATGLGVANDLSAIQSAVNAASAAGGGIVFFPPGTYLVNGTITSASNVSFVGYHRNLSVIKVASGSTLISGAYPLGIKSLKFTFSSTPYSGTLMSFTSGASRTTIEDIQVGSSTSDTPVSGKIVAAAAATVTVEIKNGVFYLTESGVLFDGANAGVTLKLEGNEIAAYSVAGVLANTLVSGYEVYIRGNSVVTVNGGSGSKTLFSASLRLVAQSNTVLIGISGITVFDGSGSISESNNLAIPASGSTVTLYGSGISGSASLATMYLQSRGMEHFEDLGTNGNSDPVTVPGESSSAYAIRTTSSAGWTGNCDININKAPGGAQLVLSVWNDTGGALTYVWGTNVAASGSTFSVSANSMRSFLLQSVYGVGGALKWHLVSSTAGAEDTE